MKKYLLTLLAFVFHFSAYSFEPVMKIDRTVKPTGTKILMDMNNMKSRFVMVNLKIAADPVKIQDTGYVLLRGGESLKYKNMHKHYVMSSNDTWLLKSYMFDYSRNFAPLLDTETEYTIALDLDEYGRVFGARETYFREGILSRRQNIVDQYKVAPVTASMWPNTIHSSISYQPGVRYPEGGHNNESVPVSYWSGTHSRDRRDSEFSDPISTMFTGRVGDPYLDFMFPTSLFHIAVATSTSVFGVREHGVYY